MSETEDRDQDELPSDLEAAELAEERRGEPAPAEPTEQERITELTNKWLRAKADIENVRRAARLEAEDARRYGTGPVVLSLLSVLDNLQRALAAPPKALDADYLAGLQLIEQQFLDVLATHGVTPVKAERGAAFDPSMHRALMEQESDAVLPGSILQLVVPGYRMHDRLLREAQVVVAKSPAPREA